MTDYPVVAIYDNSNYFITVGVSDNAATKGLKCYQIVNRATGIVEIETSILPRAIAACDDINKHLEEVRAGKAIPNVVGDSNIIQLFNDKDSA